MCTGKLFRTRDKATEIPKGNLHIDIDIYIKNKMLLYSKSPFVIYYCMLITRKKKILLRKLMEIDSVLVFPRDSSGHSRQLHRPGTPSSLAVLFSLIKPHVVEVMHYMNSINKADLMTFG